MGLRELIWDKFKIREGGSLPFIASSEAGDRHMIIRVANKVGFKVGAEIGVEWGRHALSICHLIPDIKLYCVDPYLPYFANGKRPTQSRCDHIMECAMEKMVNYDVTFIRKSSIEASKDIEDGSLDFIYIDGSHNFDSVMLDLLHWIPKVKEGGIVSGHDYNDVHLNGVIDAVRAYTQAHYIIEWYVTADIPRSFFWIKHSPHVNKGYSTFF
jgi:hypothetical protein